MLPMAATPPERRTHDYVRHGSTTLIRAIINGWNDRKHPFVWTRSANEILKKGQPSKHSRNRNYEP